MELLMLVQLCQWGKGLVTNGTKELHSTTTLRRRFLLRYSSGWTLQVWLQLLAQIPPRQVFLLQTTFPSLQLILRAWGWSIWSTWFFHTSSGNLNNNKPVMRKTAGNGKSVLNHLTTADLLTLLHLGPGDHSSHSLTESGVLHLLQSLHREVHSHRLERPECWVDGDEIIRESSI